MSLMLFEDDIIFLQRFLKSSGYYTGKLDGIWGPKTDSAVNAFEARSDQISATLGTFDARSERNILTLHPKAQEAARIFLKKILDAGIAVRIISGTRTYAEQNELYKKGRYGNPPPKVTNSRGGQSNHNFGIAWDIGIFDNGAYMGESPLYKKSADIGMVAGLEWGGNWTKFKDQPHYQLVTRKSIQIVQQRFENGEAYV
jgi:peptidoglycan L-alanyl-D-glutamate endopeptidase CwlK